MKTLFSALSLFTVLASFQAKAIDMNPNAAYFNGNSTRCAVAKTYAMIQASKMGYQRQECEVVEADETGCAKQESGRFEAVLKCVSEHL
jgi:hypothetical protein